MNISINRRLFWFLVTTGIGGVIAATSSSIGYIMHLNASEIEQGSRLLINENKLIETRRRMDAMELDTNRRLERIENKLDRVLERK